MLWLLRVHHRVTTYPYSVNLSWCLQVFGIQYNNAIISHFRVQCVAMLHYLHVSTYFSMYWDTNVRWQYKTVSAIPYQPSNQNKCYRFLHQQNIWILELPPLYNKPDDNNHADDTQNKGCTLPLYPSKQTLLNRYALLAFILVPFRSFIFMIYIPSYSFGAPKNPMLD